VTNRGKDALGGQGTTVRTWKKGWFWRGYPGNLRFFAVFSGIKMFCVAMRLSYPLFNPEWIDLIQPRVGLTPRGPTLGYRKIIFHNPEWVEYQTITT